MVNNKCIDYFQNVYSELCCAVSLSHTNEQYASNCNACFDASVAFSNEPIDTSAANNGTSAVQKSNEPTVWFLGNIWDTYIGHTQSVSHYMGFSHEEVYQALARLTRVALQLQRDMMRLVRALDHLHSHRRLS